MMTDTKDKLDASKDKIVGEVKEAVGKVTGNESLELEGKIQSVKGDIKKKMDIGDQVEEMKEDVAETINDLIDKK